MAIVERQILRVISSSLHFRINESRIVDYDDVAKKVVLVKSSTASLSVLNAPVPSRDFAVYANRNDDGGYSVLLLGITGLRSDVQVPGALGAPGEVCLTGESTDLPDRMARAIQMLIPPAPKPVSVGRLLGEHSALGTVRLRVRHAIEKASAAVAQTGQIV